MQHISYSQAMEHVGLTTLIDEMAVALAGGRRSSMSIPPRALMFSADQRDAFVSMPAYSDEEKLFVTKVGAIITPPGRTSDTTVDAIVIVYCGMTGALICTIDGNAVTNIKCAAISALVTRHCTADRPHTVAIIGSGVQARQQLLGLRHVREIAELRLFSRTRVNAERFACDIVSSGVLTCTPIVVGAVDDAVKGASIIATTTTSFTPIASFAGLRDDVHVNCMGGHTTQSREIPAEILSASRLIVEDRPTAVAEAGDIHQKALELEDMLGQDALADTRTIFSSTGHAFFDYYTARHLLKRTGLLVPHSHSISARAA